MASDPKSSEVRECLQSAIQTMLDACQRAENHLKHPRTLGVADPDNVAIREIMHTFAWAYANYQNSIENAMIRIEMRDAARKVQNDH
jgi:hypothetical protein